MLESRGVHIALDGLGRRIDLLTRCRTVGMPASLYDLVNFEHPPHGDQTGAFADDRGRGGMTWFVSFGRMLWTSE